MPERKDKDTVYVRVTDGSGKEFLCPVDALKDPDHCTEEGLRRCLDSAEEAFTDEEIFAIIKSEFRKKVDS